MPTTDPAKNVKYVKRSQAKKKDALGAVEYIRLMPMQNNDTETN